MLVAIRSLWAVMAGVFCLSLCPSWAEPGGLDPSFDFNGIVKTYVGTEASPSEYSFVTSLAIQKDGKIVAAGIYELSTWTLNLGRDFALTRYLPDGSLDTSFGNGGIVRTDMGTREDEVSKVFVLPNGRILVIGACVYHIGVARYLPDGQLDTTFGTGGRAMIPLGDMKDGPYRMGPFPAAIQPDGKIVIGAGISFQNLPYIASAGRVVRLNPDGDLDSSFGQGGVVDLKKEVTSLALLPDGSFFVGYSGYGVTELLHVTSDGALDALFGQSGKVTLDLITSTILVQEDGRCVLVGCKPEPSSNSFDDFRLARINSNGSLDGAFGENGYVLTNIDADDIARGGFVQPDGHIVVVGETNSTSYSQQLMVIARYNADGSPDATFGNGGKVTSSFGLTSTLANAVICQQDGKILAGGGMPFTIARYLVDDSASSLPFVPDVEAQLVEPFDPSMIPQSRQTLPAKRKPPKWASRARTIDVTIRNWGTLMDSFMLRGSKGSGQLEIAYLKDGQDITSSVTSGTYTTATMSPEDKISLTVVIKPTKKMNSRFRTNITLIATSSGNSSSQGAADVRVNWKSLHVRR